MSAGVASDLRVASVGLMMPLGAGLLVLVGYLWLEVFGIVLAVAAAAGWAVWWRKRHRAFFPRDVQTGPYALTISIVVIAFIIALALM